MRNVNGLGGSCDYGCGAVGIMSSDIFDNDGSGGIQIEDVECGTIRVRELANVYGARP